MTLATLIVAVVVFSFVARSSNPVSWANFQRITNTGDALVTGRTESPNFPTTPGAFHTDHEYDFYTYFDEDCQCYIDAYHSDAFVTRISP
jgi:hypothetical protein